MGVVSPVFLAATLLAALAIRLPGARVSREWLLVTASVAFIFALAGDPLATLPFWALVLGGYAVVRLSRHAARLSAFAFLVAAVVLAWWWLRNVAPTLQGGVVALGLSYAMFRILHLAIDARDDELGRPLGLRGYLCYLTFFPSYLAGPLQRYQHFAPQVENPAAPADKAGWAAAGRRAIAGLFKCTVLAGAAMALHEGCLASLAGHPGAAALLLAGAAFAFAAWLYASFAGYMDLAIAAGRVLGVTIPENFDAPLRARNFLDLWSRWHITLSDWFRFYVFNPSLKAMLERVANPGLAPWLGAVGYFLAFFLMGLWHGTTPAMVLYGLVLGLGVSVNKLWQVAIATRLGRRRHGELNDRRDYQVVAQALALAWFVLALAFLWQPLPDVARLGGAALAGAAATVFVACLPLAAASRLPWTLRAVPGGRTDRVVAAFQVAAAAGYLWWSGGAVPGLLYQWL